MANDVECGVDDDGWRWLVNGVAFDSFAFMVLG
jgi:hypothetical protein